MRRCCSNGSSPHGRAIWAVIGVFAAVLLLTQTSRAAPTGPASELRFDLKECIETALSAHPDVLEAKWDVEIARMQVEEADRGGYPDVEYTQLFGVVNEARGSVENPQSKREDFLKGLGPFTRLNFEFKLPLYTFGKISAGKHAARKGLQTEEAKRIERENQVIHDVKQLYFGLLLARQVHGVLDQIATALKEAAEAAQERLESGEESVSQRDVLQVRLGYTKIAQGARDAETGTIVALAALKRALDMKREQPFDISETRLKPATVNLKSIENYISDLFGNSPQWERLKAGIDAQRAQVTMARSDYYPTFFLAGGIEWAVAPNRDEQDNPYVRDEFNGFTPGAALGLHWSLNFISTRLGVESAEAELAKLRVQERNARLGLPLEVEKAHAEVLEAQDRMTLANDGRRAGRALYASAISSFTLGIGDAEDLFNLLGGYVQAASDYWQAVFDYNMALAELSRTIGVEVTNLSYKRPQRGSARP